MAFYVDFSQLTSNLIFGVSSLECGKYEELMVYACGSWADCIFTIILMKFLEDF
jgi:hypothetical protein